MEKEFQITEEMMMEEQTGRKVPVVSIAIAGDLKELLEAIARLEPSFGSYGHLVGAALGEGLAVLLSRAKQERSRK